MNWYNAFVFLAWALGPMTLISLMAAFGAAATNHEEDLGRFAMILFIVFGTAFLISGFVAGLLS